MAPTPPPVHGATLAAHYLLESAKTDRLQLVHVNARYARQVDQLNGGNFLKLPLMGKYLVETAWKLLRHRCRAVILTPTFVAGPFLKDSLFIWLCWMLRVPSIGWFHMDFSTMAYGTRPALYQWYVRITLRRLQRFVCVAPTLILRMPTFVQDRPMKAIPNGVPPISCGERFSGDAVKTTPVRVLYISNFLKAKGWRTLLTAAESLCEEESAIEFDFYGAPSAEYSEEAIVEIFGRTAHSERIRYRGFCEGEMKSEAYNDADIFCLPSWNEAFPLTILETMSAGLPIVATRVGGIPDAVEGAQGGRLVDPQDSKQLVSALRELIANPGLREEMSHFNRCRYLNNFSVEAFRDRWLTYLRRF